MDHREEQNEIRERHVDMRLAGRHHAWRVILELGASRFSSLVLAARGVPYAQHQ